MAKKNNITNYTPSTLWEKFKEQIQERAIIYFFIALSFLGSSVYYVITLPTRLDGKVDDSEFSEFKYEEGLKDKELSSEVKELNANIENMKENQKILMEHFKLVPKE